VKTTPVMARVLAAVEDGPMGPFLSRCWVWRRHISPNGYGIIGVKIGDGWQNKQAHRVSYESFIGPIPSGLDLDHLCRDRRCVNPNHLDPVTRSENLKRSPLMNRQGHKTHCPRGHPYSGVNSRGGRFCHKCAAATALKSYHRRKHDRPRQA